MCDPTGTFDVPTLLNGFSMANRLEISVTLSPDELNIYASVDRGAAAQGWDFVSALRADSASDFGAQSVVTALSSSANDSGGALSADGLTFALTSGRAPGEGAHLYVSTRLSTLGSFGTPSLFAGINSVNTADTDDSPFFTADGSELWFASNRARGAGSFDVYRAVRIASGFGAAVAVPELNSASAELAPVLTADKLTVYFSSDRDGSGHFDISTSHRTNVADGFPAPTVVTELNSSVNDFVDWSSPDNCRLYFRSDRSGSGDVYVAVRRPM
jgi:Tol biopolymer transport system component